MLDHARNYGFRSNKELMQYLRDIGRIRSDFVFDIMCSVDRKNFVTDQSRAYRDRPELNAYEKTISAPHMHAEVLEHMSDNLRRGKCALDIGSGSGYVTICMALALGEKGTVVGVDCIPGFQNLANLIAQTHYPKLFENDRVEYIVYDGRRGWPWNGPYDVIHVGVAAASVPESLIEQLAPGGCLVMPVGLGAEQVLVSLTKSLNGDIQRKELMKVRYGTFTEVDLPWSSTVGNRLMSKQKIGNKNIPSPKLQGISITVNGPLSTKSSKKTIEAMEKAENETIGNINEKLSPKFKKEQSIDEKIDFFENICSNTDKNIDTIKVTESQTNIATKIESVCENNDEISSTDIVIDSEQFTEDKDIISDNIQSKAFLDKCKKSNEPAPNIQTNIPTSIGSDKNKTQTVREKIEIYEEKIGNDHVQVLEKSKNSNEALNNANKPFSKSVENLMKTNDPVLNSQPSCSSILICNKMETQQEIVVNQDKTENDHNNTDQKVYVAEKELNMNSEENERKTEKLKASRDRIFTEFKLFKSEIKVILDDFLTSEKENHEEMKLRQVNLNINRVNQIQVVNSHNSQEECDGQNFEKPYENLETDDVNEQRSVEKHDDTGDLQMQVRNLSESVEKLQTQYDNNIIEKIIATNEQLQDRIVHYDDLEKRLKDLEQRFKLVTRVLVRLIESGVLEKQSIETIDGKINYLLRTISRVGEEIKTIGCNFTDSITENTGKQLVKKSEPIANAQNFEPFLSEIKALLPSEKDALNLENESSLSNNSESTDNKNYMSLLKTFLGDI